MKYVARVGDKSFTVEVREEKIVIDGQSHDVDLRHIEPLSLYSLLIDNLSHEIFIEEHEARFAAMLQGQLYDVDVQEEHLCRQDVSFPAGPTSRKESIVKAPMPGLVLEVRAKVGETAQADDVVVVLESMKMRIDLRCPQDGVIQALHAVPHDHVTQGQVLVTLSPGQGAQ
jgi:biotin carboxyl carrier protein